MQSVSVQAPGKLMIAGEWGVLMPGAPCLAMAVDRHVVASIEPSDAFRVTALSHTDVEATYANGIAHIEADLPFVEQVLSVALRYIEESGRTVEPFHLTTTSTIDTVSENGEKVGFGSSAAATVAMTGAILSTFDAIDLDTPADITLLYKLAAIAHFQAQGKVGSGYDIATSVLGGFVRYVAPDRDWLKTQLANLPSVTDLVAQDWPLLELERLSFSLEPTISVGFVGKGASTSELVKQFYASLEQGNPDAEAALENIISGTEDIIWGLQDGHQNYVVDGIRIVRTALRMLGESTQLVLETPELAKLADIAESHGAVGKFSGAGGGDIGIALSFDASSQPEIHAAWNTAHIQPIPISLSEGAHRV